LRIPDESSGLGFDLEFGDALTLSGGFYPLLMLLATPQKPMVFSTVHTLFANLVFDVNDRFKLGLSYIHSYFSGDVNLTGSTGVASRRSPFGELRLQAIPMECKRASSSALA